MAKGNTRLGLKGHNNIFTKHAFQGKSIEKLKLKPADLRGALKNHFNVDEKQNWIQSMITQDP